MTRRCAWAPCSRIMPSTLRSDAVYCCTSHRTLAGRHRPIAKAFDRAVMATWLQTHPRLWIRERRRV